MFMYSAYTSITEKNEYKEEGIFTETREHVVRTLPQLAWFLTAQTTYWLRFRELLIGNIYLLSWLAPVFLTGFCCIVFITYTEKS